MEFNNLWEKNWSFTWVWSLIRITISNLKKESFLCVPPIHLKMVSGPNIIDLGFHFYKKYHTSHTSFLVWLIFSLLNQRILPPFLDNGILGIFVCSLSISFGNNFFPSELCGSFNFGGWMYVGSALVDMPSHELYLNTAILVNIENPVWIFFCFQLSFTFTREDCLHFLNIQVIDLQTIFSWTA